MGRPGYKASSEHLCFFTVIYILHFILLFFYLHHGAWKLSWEKLWLFVCKTHCIFTLPIFITALLILQLPQKLNEFDNEGNIPLNLALLSRNEGIANTLVSHSCDLDLVDPSGNSLLHLAIMRGDTFSASFLIKNGANTILARKESQETPLHLVASYKPSQVTVQSCIGSWLKQ